MKQIFSLDLRSLAAFRICLGIVILIDLGIRSRDLDSHYTDFGVLSRDAAIAYTASWHFSFHMANGALWFQVLLFVIAALFVTALILGYKTRTATIVSWVLLLSLQNRNFLLLQGGDNLLLLLLFWSMFLPLGARYSIDAALNTSIRNSNNQYFSAASMGLLIQAMSVYFFSAFLKSAPEWYPDGSALYYALSLAYFTTPAGVWLLQFSTLTKALTYYVWLLELLGPLIIFSPVYSRQCRTTVMILFILMEVGFIIFLRVGIFPFVSITSLIAFIPAKFWDLMLQKINTQERRNIRLYYNHQHTSHKKFCLLLETFLLIPDLRVIESQDNPVTSDGRTTILWLTTDQKGRSSVNMDAIIEIVRRSPVFHPLAWLLRRRTVRVIAKHLIERIDSHRYFISRLIDRFFPFNSTSDSATWLGQILASSFLIIITYWNLTTLPQISLPFPASLVAIKNSFRLHQKWDMFAPSPMKLNISIAIEGKLNDGSVVDVYNMKQGEPDWANLRNDTFPFENFRWRKYLGRIQMKKFEKYRLYYGRYLCRKWNRNRDDPQKLNTFKIYAIVQRNLLDSKKTPAEKVMIWNHHCFKKST
ncbi:MAG: HTTM domain-containing protein [Methylococcaceae bacterium]|nr:HTTM domain-containing protein [Methylococcaceae bacterium]